jgi:hypothetical protein
VEDDKDAAQALALLLRAWGREVQVARDGPQALRSAGDRWASPGTNGPRTRVGFYAEGAAAAGIRPPPGLTPLLLLQDGEAMAGGLSFPGLGSGKLRERARVAASLCTMIGANRFISRSRGRGPAHRGAMMPPVRVVGDSWRPRSDLSPRYRGSGGATGFAGLGCCAVVLVSNRCAGWPGRPCRYRGRCPKAPLYPRLGLCPFPIPPSRLAVILAQPKPSRPSLCCRWARPCPRGRGGANSTAWLRKTVRSVASPVCGPTSPSAPAALLVPCRFRTSAETGGHSERPGRHEA